MTSGRKSDSLPIKNRICAVAHRVLKTQASAYGMKPRKPASSSPGREQPTHRKNIRAHANDKGESCGSGAAHGDVLMQTTTRRRLPGFTLTELLVVIAIIAVLAAIAFPVTLSVREKAKAAACALNLRQIGIGLIGYISENNGRFPNGSLDVSWLKDADNNSLGLCWYDAAAQNMGRGTYSNKSNDPAADPLPDIFSCPSGHRKAYHPAWPYTGDYAANMFLGNPSNPNNPLTLSAVKRPESTPYVQDTVKQNQFGQGIYGTGFSRTANAAFATRHNGRGNILWVDGHVSSLTYGEYMKFAKDPKRGGVNNFIRGNW